MGLDSLLRQSVLVLFHHFQRKIAPFDKCFYIERLVLAWIDLTTGGVPG